MKSGVVGSRESGIGTIERNRIRAPPWPVACLSRRLPYRLIRASKLIMHRRIRAYAAPDGEDTSSR
eukprot:scaffold425508_cov15-Prasinocladus_malaysianus.AAC.1